MNWPRLDRRLGLDARILPGDAGDSEAEAVKPPFGESPFDGDLAQSALEMISDAAAAIRQLQQQAAKAVARARSIAEVTIEKLDAATARAERAERAQQTAEIEAADRKETLAAACNEIETLSAQLAATENELIAARNRANDAEWRADESERRAAEATAAVERIVLAIRDQFPADVGSAAKTAEQK